MKDYNYWNNLKDKPDEVKNAIAEENDLVIEIGGIIFLLQRRNNFNNVVCYRIKESKMTLYKTLYKYREFLIEQGIKYIRVEGDIKRYFFLQKVKLPDSGYNAIKDTKQNDRNVFYIKLF